VGLRDHGEPERVRHPLAVGPAVGGEVEHRLDQRLEGERGAHLADEARLDVAVVPEAMDDTRLDDDDLARPGLQPLAADLHADRPLDHLEALGLVRMQVGGRDDPVRAHRRLDQHVLAVRRCGGLEECEPLTRDLVLDGLADGDHCVLRVSCGAPLTPLTEHHGGSVPAAVGSSG
jgi:hypothetical protein